MSRLELDKAMGLDINIGLITALPYMRNFDCEHTILTKQFLERYYNGNEEVWKELAPQKEEKQLVAHDQLFFRLYSNFV